MKYQGAFSRNMGFVGKHFLFSLPPLFFCSRSNFRAITQLEKLATQATPSFILNLSTSPLK